MNGNEIIFLWVLNRYPVRFNLIIDVVNRIYTLIHSNVETYKLRNGIKYIYLLNALFRDFPLLKTERLILRSAELKDVPYILANHSDDSVMKYLGTKKLSSMLEAEELIADAEAVFQKKKGIRWAITIKGEDCYVGSIGMWRLDKLWEKAEVGYELSTRHWGKGYMTEALSRVLKFGFEKLQVGVIEANVDIQNLRSGHLLEKLGFEEVDLPYSQEKKHANPTVVHYSMCKK